MPFYGDVQGEIDAIGARADARAAADAQAQQITLNQVNRANMIQRNYAWLPAGASLSMAYSGLDDETVHRVASAALQGAQQNTALGLNQPGDLVSSAVEAKRSSGGGFFGKALGALKTGVGWASGVTPIVKGAQALTSDSNPVGHHLRDNWLTNNVAEPAINDTVNSAPLRGVTRDVTAVLDAPRQYIQGSYRNFSNDVMQQGWASAIKNQAIHSAEGVNPAALEQTDAGQSLINAPNVDQGRGFFVGQQSGVGAARQAAEAQYGQIKYADGSMHNRSIGRDFASMFVEPGTRPFQVLSGFGDAGVAVGADLPSQHLVSGLHAATEFKALGEGIEYGDEVSRAAKIKDAMGLIFNPGQRATYSPNVLENWLGSKTGIAITQKIADGDAQDIFQMTKGKIPGELLGALALEDTPDGVRNILRAGLGQGTETLPTTALGRYGITGKTYVPEEFQRIMNRMPAKSAWNADDPTEAMQQLDRGLDYMNTPADVKRDLMNKMAAIPHIPNDRVTWNLRKQVYIDAFNGAIERAAAPQLALAQSHAPEGFDVLHGEMNQGTYLPHGNEPESVLHIGQAEPLTQEARNKVQQARDAVAKLKTILNPLKEHTFQDHVLYDTDNEGQAIGFFNRTVQQAPGAAEGDLTGAQLLPSGAEGNPDEGKLLPGASDRPQPHLLNEFHGQFMPVPDWQQAHRTITSLGPLLNNPAFDMPLAMINDIQEKVWKPLIVMRPAGLLRMIFETQASMYADGLTNVFSHPIKAISLMLSDSSLADRLGIEQGVGGLTSDALGNSLGDSDELRRVLNQKTVFSSQTAAKYLPDEMVRVPQGEAGFHNALASEIEKMAHTRSDPLPKMIASAMQNNESLDTVKEQLWNMEKYRQDLQDIAPYRPDDVRLLDHRWGSDAYVDSVADRIRTKTGLNPELINEIVNPSLDRGDLIKTIKGLDQSSLPDVAVGPRQLLASEKKSYTAGVNYLFGKLLGDPLNTVSVSPATRETYWKGMLQRAPLINPDDAPALLANAEKAGVAKSDLRQLKYFAERPIDNPISLDTADQLSKSDAIDTLQKLFVNHVEQRRLTAAIKTVSPFAHVWSETLLRWSKFMAQDPTLLHNLEYGFHEATDPTTADATPVGSLMGVPPGRGFLFPDQNGQERFAYPLSAQMMNAAVGTDTPLTGSLQGLSLGFDVMPGVGPIASAALSDLIPKTPEWDNVRSVVFPQGQPKSLLDLKAQMPAWAQRAFDLKDQRTMASTTMDMMNYKLSTGSYDIHNADPTVAEAETKRLLSDSRSTATWFTVLRGLAGAVAPSAPAPEFWQNDKSGTRLMLDSLKTDYNKMYHDDPQHAVLNFMQKYGDNAMLAIQGKTISTALGGGLPVTKGAETWARQNGSLAQDLPLAYGFFAPRTDTKFDPSVYDRLLTSGQRAQLTPEQFLQESNKRVAQTMYYAARSKMPAVLNAQQAAYMRDLRDGLSAQYPGYASQFGEEIVGVPAQASVGQSITQLQKAASDKRLADNPATVTLQDYMKIRDQIQAQSAGALGSPDLWQTSVRGKAARAYLYNVGTQLATQNPAFGPMWESVLYREFQSSYEKDQGVVRG